MFGLIKWLGFGVFAVFLYHFIGGITGTHSPAASQKTMAKNKLPRQNAESFTGNIGHGAVVPVVDRSGAESRVRVGRGVISARR